MTPTSSPSAARPLSDHMLNHKALRARFEDLQCALISLDLERASTGLADFTRHIRLHREGEEEFILPVYRDLDLGDEEGVVESFLSEHKELGWWLGEMRSDLDALRELAQTKEIGPQEVLPLLDRQATFKQLLAHHDQREADLLFPALDRKLTRDQAEEIWRQLDEHEDSVRASWA